MTQPSETAPTSSLPVDENSSKLTRVESDTPRLPPGRAIRQINDALGAESSITGFLPIAENTLLAASDDFTGGLGVEAIRIARERGATAVDKEDVLAADSKLRDYGEAEKRGWFTAVAGLVGGGALGGAITLALTPDSVRNTGIWWVLIAGFGVISVFLFSISFPRRRRRFVSTARRF